MSGLKKTLDTPEAIEEMVHLFYAEVRKDDLIGPIFNETIGDSWDRHLKKLTGFWKTILLNEQAYSGSPFPPHMKLSIGKEHFERWLKLFRLTLETHFTGDNKNEAIWRAEKMAEMFQYKLSHLKNQQHTIT